jgi:hypothetical protein
VIGAFLIAESVTGSTPHFGLLAWALELLLSINDYFLLLVKRLNANIIGSWIIGNVQLERECLSRLQKHE